MPTSPLQDIFLRELAETCQASHRRIMRRLAGLPPNDAAAQSAVIRGELRGLFHGFLVIFDGGTALADHGLVSIVDENDLPFDRHLHEICLRYWLPEAAVEPGADESAPPR